MTISTRARLVIPACSLAAGQVAIGQTFGSIDGESPGAVDLSHLQIDIDTSRLLHLQFNLIQDGGLKAGLLRAQRNESLEVHADAAAHVTDHAAVGTVIDNERIAELPLNGRNYLQLVSLAPNVSTGFSGQGQAVSRQGGIRASETMAVGGQRTSFNHYTLDGVENTDPNSRLQRGEKCA